MIGKSAVKEQNKLSMIGIVVEELVPDRTLELADVRDELKSKFGLKNVLKFSHEHSYNESNSRGSCSFASWTSSNIDMKILSLKDSAIFAELCLELSCKD